jgi:hypothetical protein
MSQDPKQKDKAEEENQPKRKLPPGWRNFQKVLKRVVKAPPMKKSLGSPHARHSQET